MEKHAPSCFRHPYLSHESPPPPLPHPHAPYQQGRRSLPPPSRSLSLENFRFPHSLLSVVRRCRGRLLQIKPQQAVPPASGTGGGKGLSRIGGGLDYRLGLSSFPPLQSAIKLPLPPTCVAEIGFGVVGLGVGLDAEMNRGGVCGGGGRATADHNLRRSRSWCSFCDPFSSSSFLLLTSFSRRALHFRSV